MLSTPVIHTFPFPWVEKFPFDPVIVYITSRRVIDAKERKGRKKRGKKKEDERKKQVDFSLFLSFTRNASSWLFSSAKKGKEKTRFETSQWYFHLKIEGGKKKKRKRDRETCVFSTLFQFMTDASDNWKRHKEFRGKSTRLIIFFPPFFSLSFSLLSSFWNGGLETRFSHEGKPSYHSEHECNLLFRRFLASIL